MNIVFDIGNVLLSFDPGRYLVQTLDREKTDALLDTVFRSEQWQQLDRGTISFDRALRVFVERQPDLAQEIHTVMHGWVEMLKPIPATMHLLREWSGQHTLYYLSNMPEQASRYLLDRYDFWGLFEGGIFSYTTGLIKPDRTIYELLLTKYRLRAGDCVFIDDLQENVDTAVAVGMRGIHFREGVDLSAALQAVCEGSPAI